MLPWHLQRFAGEKTERATPERRREARRAGQIPRSADLTAAVTVLGAVLALRLFGGFLWGGWLRMLQTSLGHLAATPISSQSLHAMAISYTRWFVWLSAPVAGAALVFAWLTGFAQVGAYFRPQAILPDFKRIDPVAGFKRLWSLHSAAELVKSLCKLAIVAVVAYTSVQQSALQLSSAAGVPPVQLPGWIGGLVFQTAVRIAGMLLLLALADYLFQRFEYERSIRMSREEIREEMKRREGDPMVKSRIRQRGRALAMRRMMQEVPKADVVVTNPTHLAVALKYDASSMSAPVVVAKGADELARRMRELAMVHSVPVVEDRPLAQALYQRVEIGRVIPPDLYQAVAQVLAYVYRLRGRVGGEVSR